jgi:hypothetical protein
MKHVESALYFLGVLAALTSSQSVLGQFIEFEDEAEWLAAAGTPTTIAFNDLPALTTVTTQYLSQGVSFTDGTDFISSGLQYPQDGFGLRGSNSGIPVFFPEISMEFSTSQHAIAVHYPGAVQFELYSEDTLVYTSSVMGTGFFNQFAGIVSSMPIDRVRLSDPGDIVLIDNLYFAVPAPGGLTLLAFATFTLRGRRRTGCDTP